MPRKKAIDFKESQKQLLAFLSAQDSAQKASEACRALGVSQATFSKLAAPLIEEKQIIKIGRAQNTRYLRSTPRPFMKKRFLPLFAIEEDGKVNRLAKIWPLSAGNFFVEEGLERKNLEEELFDSLPYFLDSLRPAGFLGRLVPKQNPALGLPENIDNWSEDDVLFFLSQAAWNGPGNLLLGEKSFELYQKNLFELQNYPTKHSSLEEHYDQFADDVVNFGEAGSSAAGEQAKFTTVIADPKNPFRIVKFSPPMDSNIGRRIADCLMAEKLALDVLNETGIEAAQSRMLCSKPNSLSKRIYLDSARFDRVALTGRRGILSLEVVSAHFLGGKQGNWIEQGERLLEKQLISQDELIRICRCELFGRLIGNNDRHLGNYSFFSDGFFPKGGTPVYDMLPARYMPKQGNLPRLEFETPFLDDPRYLDSWIWALAAAKNFWEKIRKNQVPEQLDQIEFSKDFRQLATEAINKLEKLSRIAL